MQQSENRKSSSRLIDGKHLPTEEVFERVNDEHDGGDFQNPKRHHGEAVSDKELNKRRR